MKMRFNNLKPGKKKRSSSIDISNKKKFQISLLLLICIFNNLQLVLNNAISDSKAYTNIPGTQIYLYVSSTYYSYLSIDDSDTSKMVATIYLYSSRTKDELKSVGIYTSVGFGPNVMKDSDILLCGMNKDESTFCKDYTGIFENITLKSSQAISMTGSKITEITDDATYKTCIEWSFTRVTSNLDGIINSTVGAIATWGTVFSSGTPDEHPGSANYQNIRTGDGNTDPSTNNGSTQSFENTNTGGNGSDSDSGDEGVSTSSDASLPDFFINQNSSSTIKVSFALLIILIVNYFL